MSINTVKVFEALGDPIRYRILNLILERDPKELCPCTIFAVLGISRSLFSHRESVSHRFQ